LSVSVPVALNWGQYRIGGFEGAAVVGTGTVGAKDGYGVGGGEVATAVGSGVGLPTSNVGIGVGAADGFVGLAVGLKVTKLTVLGLCVTIAAVPWHTLPAPMQFSRIT